MNSKTIILSVFAIATISAAQPPSQMPDDTGMTNQLATKTVVKTTETNYFPVTGLATKKASGKASESLTLSAAGYMVSETIPSFLTMVMAMIFM